MLCMRDFEACQKTILMIWLIHYSNLLASNLFEKREWKDTLVEQKGEKNNENYRNKKNSSFIRKLSVAVAIIGFPKVLILDEPSCGLDPGARRQLWGVISGAQKAGAAVLLTSHSMEEASALCNSLAIIVNGRLKCIGG